MRLNGLMTPLKKPGLMGFADDETSNQDTSAEKLEAALKKRRDKLAETRLHLAPENESAI